MGVNSEKLPFFLETTQQEFDHDLFAVPGFTFVVFHRHGCKACDAYDPVIGEFSERNSSKMRFMRVAVSHDNDDDFNHKHSILGQPTSVVYYNTARLFYIRGAGFEPNLTNSIQEFLDKSAQNNMCPSLQLILPDPAKAYYYLPDITPPPPPKPGV